MNRRDLRLNSLRAFESAARQMSLSKAAKELGVTHSAISHQIKQLEEQLGIDLFIRSGHGVELSESGKTLLPVLQDAFEQMLSALNQLHSRIDRDNLCITTTPTFASRWLVPKLSTWNRMETGIHLRLIPTLEYLNLENTEIEVGIRCGQPPWPGLHAELLRPIYMTPVCSPTLLKNRKPQTVEDLFQFDLIHADIQGHQLGEEWRMWLKSAGVQEKSKLHGHSFHDPSIALQAAVDGQGIAMGYLDLVETDIQLGRLVCPFQLKVKHYFSYYLIYPQKSAGSQKLRQFKDWIMSYA